MHIFRLFQMRLTIIDTFSLNASENLRIVKALKRSQVNEIKDASKY